MSFQGTRGRRSSPQVKRRVDHLALGHAARAVAPVEGQVFARAVHGVTEQRVAPAHLAVDMPRVGIEQQLVGIEAVPFPGPVRSVHAIAVEHARTRLRQVAMPDQVGLLAQLDALQLAPARVVEDAQFDFLRVFGEQREVDALAVPGCPERIGAAGPDRVNRVHARSLMQNMLVQIARRGERAAVARARPARGAWIIGQLAPGGRRSPSFMPPRRRS